MRRLLATYFVIGAMWFAAQAENASVAVSAGQAGADAAFLRADHTLQQALARKDAKAVGTLLDQDFHWTNETGKSTKSGQFLHDVAAGAAVGPIGDGDLKARAYGQLAIVTGTGGEAGKPGAFFARIWVKRPAGWLLLLQQDTRILGKGSSSQQAPAPASAAAESADCDNPCKTVPYSPKTADEGAVVKAYQAVETAVVSHDPQTWAYHVADEFVGIGRRYFGMPDTKAGRVGQIGIVSNRVILPKMLWLQVYVFGDAALMIADHQPAGEPPYDVIRVWVNRDGRWQLFHRQETTIEQGVVAK